MLENVYIGKSKVKIEDNITIVGINIYLGKYSFILSIRLIIRLFIYYNY